MFIALMKRRISSVWVKKNTSFSRPAIVPSSDWYFQLDLASPYLVNGHMGQFVQGCLLHDGKAPLHAKPKRGSATLKNQRTIGVTQNLSSCFASACLS